MRSDGLEPPRMPGPMPMPGPIPGGPPIPGAPPGRGPGGGTDAPSATCALAIGDVTVAGPAQTRDEPLQGRGMQTLPST
ncbi:MAG: hypothetical protein GEU80_10925 [Dehalococcoidia bacterium]|nr:hypothetical protein [Dehalococcoidia bacterium]